MKRINYLYIILISLLVFQSCRKDVDDIEIIPPNILPVSFVISSIHGNVVDDIGNVVSGAIVTHGNESVETDENGVFQFFDEKLNKNGTFISVKKEGYFNGSRRFYPSVGTKSIVNIELIALEVNGSFNSGVDSKIEHDGVELEFPGNAITNEDGTEFNGMVNVAVAYLDPSDVNTLDQMPGDLTGTSVDGDFVALKSLAMIAVELLDDSGNKLQVKEGKLVDVKIPIPSNLQDAAPVSIPMWHFNEDIGIWQEEGSADLVGNNYETSLAHFSFWNCDIPMDFIFMKCTILNRGIPIQGIKVVVIDRDSNASGYGITDENGMVSGYIPEGEELTLIVYNQCGEAIYTTTIGEFEDDVILEPISLNFFIDFAILTGSVSFCDGALSEYTYVRVIQGSQTYSFPVVEDGTFHGNMSYCNEGDPIIVTAYDPIQGLISGEYIFTLDGEIEVGNIELCEVKFVEYIIVEYGDEKWNLLLDDNLTFNFSFGTDPFFEGDEGFILSISYESEPGTTQLFYFYLSYMEGSPLHKGQLVHQSISNSSVTGNAAKGLFSSQLVVQDGVEYYLASGIFTGDTDSSPHITNEPIYFDILIKNN